MIKVIGMKRLLILAVLCLMVMPVVGSVSPIKTTFQDYSANAITPRSQGDWYFGGTSDKAQVLAATSTGAIYTKVYDNTFFGTSSGYIQNINPTSFTYAGYTLLAGNDGTFKYHYVAIYDAAGSLLWKSGTNSATAPARYELVMSGGSAYWYKNDVLVSNSGALATTPSYLRIYPDDDDAGAVRTDYYDNIILGYSDDATIIGALPSDYFILYDSTAPASTGLYQLNATPSGAPILKNSNYFGISYGRGIPDATTLQLINPSGTVIKSYAVANMSCECVLPITDMQVSGAPITNGKWSVKLADDPTTAYWWVMTSGAVVAWDKNSYGANDPATIVWDVTNNAWNVSVSEAYIFKLRIFDIYGTDIYNGVISTQTGSYTFDWTSANDPGVYYAAITRTNTLAPITTVMLNYDTTELTAYAKFTGYVHNADNQTPIPSALVSLEQLGVTYTCTTASNGAYTLDGFITGGTIHANVTAATYGRYNYSFTPLSAKTVNLNFTLIPNAPLYSGIAIGGLFRESVYGRPIPLASASITNATYAEAYTVTSNNVGYYLLDLADGATLTKDRWYSIVGSKLGYANSPTYLKQAVGL